MKTRKWWIFWAPLRTTWFVFLSQEQKPKNRIKETTLALFERTGLELERGRECEADATWVGWQKSNRAKLRTNKPLTAIKQWQLTASRSAAAGGQWVARGGVVGVGGRESGRQTKRQAAAHARTADYVSCSSLTVLPTRTLPASCFNNQRSAAALWLTLANLLSQRLPSSITNYNSVTFAYSNYNAIKIASNWSLITVLYYGTKVVLLDYGVI